MTYFSYLRTFVNVYRCGSHNKASEVMGLTQPAISKQIAALEQQLGKPLFHRDVKHNI
jgi:DNA-binding transcriptional LysR family regulator